MSISGRDREAESLEREAHRWVVHLVSGEATTADAAAFKRWYRESPAHEQAFATASRRWKNFGPAGRAVLEDGRAPVWTPPEPMMSRRAVLGGLGAVAAGAVGYAALQPPFGLWPSLFELAADYRTGTGEQRQIALSEAVSMRLNTQTSVALPPAGGLADEIKLIAGEASFAISAALSKPFVVRAGNGRSVASRARFDVRSVGATVWVTCLDGEVQVEQGTQATIVSAHQQLRYGTQGLQSAVKIDAEEASAWHDGILVFRLTPLSDVVAEINRYRPGKVVLMNRDLGANPVNGRFSVQRIDQVLVWIEQAFGATARSLPGGIVLLS